MAIFLKKPLKKKFHQSKHLINSMIMINKLEPTFTSDYMPWMIFPHWIQQYSPWYLVANL
jgi:hypothetical protein